MRRTSMIRIRRLSGSAVAAALFLVFGAGLLLFGGCAGAPPRAGAPGAEEPPTAAGIPPSPPEVSRPQAHLPAVRTESASGRPVRVLLGGPQKEISIAGESIRAWSFEGALLGEESGQVRLHARGGRIAWGAEKTLPSPVDIASTSGLRLNGKLRVHRVRVSAAKDRLEAVAVLQLEDYVAAVVSREAPPAFHPEALSALAVAARTYALLAMEKPRGPTHDLVSGVEDQVFEGTDGIAEMFRKAAASTRGEVLSYQGALARTVFHSTCGGKTETARNAWGRDVPYLRSLACDDCLASPTRRWEHRMTAKEGKRVALSLGVRANEGLRIDVAERSSTGRVSRIRIASGGVSREVSASAFRREAGYARVKSLAMKIVPAGNGWIFSGNGYGHGVGMCQWGADGMAENGKTYSQILARYYPGTVLAASMP